MDISTQSSAHTPWLDSVYHNVEKKSWAYTIIHDVMQLLFFPLYIEFQTGVTIFSDLKNQKWQNPPHLQK